MRVHLVVGITMWFMLACASALCFGIIGIVAFLVFLVLLKTLPKMPSGGAVSLRSLSSLLKTPKLLGVYGITMCLITAHFITYSYIEPFLAQSANFSNNAVNKSIFSAFFRVNSSAVIRSEPASDFISLLAPSFFSNSKTRVLNC